MATQRQDYPAECTLQYTEPAPGGNAPVKKTFSADRISLGRDRSNDVCFASWPTVSSQHARILFDGSSWLVEHLSKTNPTYVNGRPIQRQSYIYNGDKIQLSAQGPEIVFQIQSQKTNPTRKQTSHDPLPTPGPPVNESRRPGENQKNCQFCSEKILESANVCKHCQRQQLTPKQIKEKADTISSSYWWLVFIASLLLANIVPWLFFVGLLLGAAAMGFYARHITGNWAVIEIYDKAALVKEHRRRRTRNFLIIIGAAILVLVLTNPNEQDLKNYIKTRDNMNMMDVTASESYVLLSVYQVEIIDFSGRRYEEYVGILGRFYPIE